MIHNLAQAEIANETLPCGAKFISADQRGPLRQRAVPAHRPRRAGRQQLRHRCRPDRQDRLPDPARADRGLDPGARRARRQRARQPPGPAGLSRSGTEPFTGHNVWPRQSGHYASHHAVPDPYQTLGVGRRFGRRAASRLPARGSALPPGPQRRLGSSRRANSRRSRTPTRGSGSYGATQRPPPAPASAATADPRLDSRLAAIERELATDARRKRERRAGARARPASRPPSRGQATGAAERPSERRGARLRQDRRQLLQDPRGRRLRAFRRDRRLPRAGLQGDARASRRQAGLRAD